MGQGRAQGGAGLMVFCLRDAHLYLYWGVVEDAVAAQVGIHGGRGGQETSGALVGSLGLSGGGADRTVLVMVSSGASCACSQRDRAVLAHGLSRRSGALSRTVQ